MDVNYKLYLVTDDSAATHGARHLLEVVEQALVGGVRVVQYREKKLEAKHMIDLAIKLRVLCEKYNAKFIVNDRVDVAWASRAHGVHLGQDDISIKDARSMLGASAIIGASCSTKEEALKAIDDGADYLGIGTVYATPTKTNTARIIGIAGVRDIVAAVGKTTKNKKHIPCVAIGGLNTTNIQTLDFKCHTIHGKLSGVAVVSAIMGATSPRNAAQELIKLLDNSAPWDFSPEIVRSSVEDLLKSAPGIVSTMTKFRPITHNMTNIVVANFVANVAIAAGASPIMSKAKEEVKDLAKLRGGLVINIGTSTPEDLPAFTAGVQAYNNVGGPVLLDPVGVGASQMRFDIVAAIMNNGYIDIIKGNGAELRSLLSGNTAEQQKGVDGESATSEDEESAVIAYKLAKRERCIVLLTGRTDYLSDGLRTYSIENGTDNLANITGSGCALGALVVACVAMWKQDKLIATLAAVLFYEIAAEMADKNPACKGPGTFLNSLIDVLKHFRDMSIAYDHSWMVEPKVKQVLVDLDEEEGEE